MSAKRRRKTNNMPPVDYKVKRKTNDTELRNGDTIYDRDGNRYKFVSHTLLGLISAVRILARPRAGEPEQSMTANPDWFGVYFDPPHVNQESKATRERKKALEQRELMYEHWKDGLRKEDKGIAGTKALTLEEYDRIIDKAYQKKRRDREEAQLKELMAQKEAQIEAGKEQLDRESLMVQMAKYKFRNRT
tara:strand:+ start:342 stop:911 length:570 start_codon:yes stop_codon:yes gene_type:complete